MGKPLIEYDPKELNLELLGTLQSALIAKLMLVNRELSRRYRKLVELSAGLPNTIKRLGHWPQAQTGARG